MTYVLVHGAWHGGWCWQRVRPLLRAAGHRVHSPSLTGLGERKHLARREINLDLHIIDIIGLLEMEDLKDVVLVGHSYGGMVITGVADRAPKRIAKLVYLDAFVPENGKAAADYIVPERAAGMRAAAKATGMVPPPPMSLWGITDPKDIAWIKPREAPHPLQCMVQPMRFTDTSAWTRIPKTFIYCSQPATGSFDSFAAKYRKDPAWRFHELKTGHDAMILQPKELANILLKELK
jgi:pimeloyl-ACP methyl ester carboxylesterase